MYVPRSGMVEWGANKPALIETERGTVGWSTVNDFRLFNPPGTPRSVPLKPAGLVESLHYIAPLRGFEEWGYPHKRLLKNVPFSFSLRLRQLPGDPLPMAERVGQSFRGKDDGVNFP